MKKYSVVIFDHIDTLTESMGISEVADSIERELGAGTITALIDGGNIDTMASPDAIVERYKQTHALSSAQEELLRRWIEWTNVALYPDTIPALEYLKSRGYRLGLISNSPPTTRDPLQDLGLRQYIDCSVFSYEAKYRKPEKEIFLALLEEMSVSAAEALMIGDDFKNDIAGAHAAGIDAILLDRKNQSDYQPKIISLSELRNIL